MSKTLESIFISEYRKEVANIGYKNIYKIPIPDECENWEVSGTELYAVKGITNEEFSELNKKIVRKLSSDYVAKRRKIDKATRAYAKDEDGNYIYEDFTVPSGSMVVLSNECLGLSFTTYKKKVSKDGYGYVDVVNKDGNKEYMYVLPKSVLYKVNQTALALSVKNMKNFSGCGYMTWNNGMIFLHIIPYKPNSKYDGTRILKTGYTLNYDKEVELLVNYWQAMGVIPNIVLCALSDGTNLATKGTTVGYDSYTPVDSIAISDKDVYGSDTEQ